MKPEPICVDEKPSFTPDDIESIDHLIQKQPDITRKEIIKTFGLHVSGGTLRKAILKLGYFYKEKSLCASEQEYPSKSGKRGKLEQTHVGIGDKLSGLS